MGCIFLRILQFYIRERKITNFVEKIRYVAKSDCKYDIAMET